MQMSRTRFALAPLALAAALALGATPAVWAQTASAVEISLAAQPLSQALTELARQTRTTLVAAPALLAGKTAPAVSGRFTTRQAADRLLAGSGLVAHIDGNAITVQQAPQADAATDPALATVTVTAQSERSATTEGNGSYAPSAIQFGKGEQKVREIPQSVTVVTRQRIEDQGLTSIGEVLGQTTGVTLESSGYNGAAEGVYSRGFKIGNVQVDGAAIDGFGANYSPNLAQYDSVQVVRGPDGLFGGTGTPGGSVNLVRKRPTHTPQTQVTLSAGRWNQYGAELDVAGPLTQNGNVRGRALVSHTDREFFYDNGKARTTLLYGIVEADLTPSTMVTLGASHEQLDDAPWRTGLPRYANGADLGLPRNTSLFPTWNDRSKTSSEVFAQLDQRLAGDWRLKVHANVVTFDSDIVAVEASGAIDPLSGTIPGFFSSHKQYGTDKYALDINASGSFPLLGREHKLLVGMDWQKVKNDEYNIVTDFNPALTPKNVFNFDPHSIPYPSLVWRSGGYPDFGATQKALYGRLTANLSDRTKAIFGGRYSSYAYQSPYVAYNRAGDVTSSSRTGYKESGIFTPYAGLVHDLSDRWTAYGSIAEIHQSQASRLQGPLPGTPLDAITGRNYELGLKGEHAGGRLTSAFALYRIERNGEAVRDPGYPSTAIGAEGLNCCHLPQGKVVSQGIDAEISGQLARNWQLFAGYTYNSNSNKTTHLAYHSRTPRHLFKLWTSYRLPEDLSAWTVGAGVNLQSATHVAGTANTYNPVSGLFNGPGVPFRFSQAGYAVWNASVQYRINRTWSAALNVNNLFDKTYYKQIGNSASGNWYGDPRNVVLSLRGRF
ncbi:TonB-dependent siderophore receptor [Hydrogenophaga palleronii]|uniref:TonB-dependent siderophore receptor n=1 Tax=Hydrogenophaga palleronii TaxID=65655 RepID=UPI000B178317|nr:TonB-dependent receptor [Hydrogenophaga palleronii]